MTDRVASRHKDVLTTHHAKSPKAALFIPPSGFTGYMRSPV
jgi:hypothetical protein